MEDIEMPKQDRNTRINRRRHIASSAGVAAGLTIVKPSAVKAYAANSKIEVGYQGKAWVRGNKGGYRGGEVENLYTAEIARNLDKFAKAVREQSYQNDTLQRSVDSTLATILGREAEMHC